jgi:hypothetical protein
MPTPALSESITKDGHDAQAVNTPQTISQSPEKKQDAGNG